MKMIDVFTGLLLVALIGGGFLLARRLFERRNMMNPPMEMPWQSEYGSRDDYGQSIHPNQGYASLTLVETLEAVISAGSKCKCSAFHL
jgi:hypothetical protein